MLLPQLLLPPLQSLLSQRQHLPKLKINRQPRGRHLNAAESALEDVEVAEMAADLGMEDAPEDLVMAASDS